MIAKDPSIRLALVMAGTFCACIALADPIDLQITHGGEAITYHAQTKQPKAVSNAAAKSVDGTLEVLQSDDFSGKGQSSWHYFVRDANGRRIELNVDGLPRDLKGGSRVRIQGKQGVQPDTIDPDAITVLSEP